MSDLTLISGPYSPELSKLMEYEKTIEQGLETFLEVGWAAKQIRDGEHFRAAGYDTFDDYCARRWDWTQRQANRVIAASEIVKTIEATGPNGPEVVPSNEAQARELAPLRKEPEKLVEAWTEAVERAGERPITAKMVAEVVAEKTGKAPKSPVNKQDIGGGVSHPAQYSSELLPLFETLLDGYERVLDPFAGTGLRLKPLTETHDLVGVELEPEFIQADWVQQGNALDLDFADGSFDAICTSPTYGNRLADHHNASDPERRRSYTHDLGRQLTEDNSGAMQWGEDYRTFHKRAWAECARVLAPGGRFVLNIKDHIRNGQVQRVSGWHVKTLLRDLGFEWVTCEVVGTPSLNAGENASARVAGEFVFVLEKP